MPELVAFHRGSLTPRRDVQVIVPAKRLTDAKSRLRHVLDDAGREALVLAMLSRVIGAAQTARRTAGVAVVTSDPTIAAWVTAHGARVIADVGRTLNGSLQKAMQHPWLEAADACAVLPGDLPNLTGAAVDALLKAVDAPDRMVVVSDQHVWGTSALAWRRGSFDGFRFGRASFFAHQRAALAAGFTVDARAADPAFFDVDDAESLGRVVQRGSPLSFAIPQPEFEAHA